MKHGYTNRTVSTDGVVRKHFRGVDAEDRAQREAAALRWARHHLPVPVLLTQRRLELDLRFVVGRHGQDAIDRAPRSVLRRCGELARRVGSLPPPDLLRDRGDGTVVVHGDFGPQNLLLDDRLRKVVALLDWERVRLGDPVEDLAWAEWIVRRHHPAAVAHLDALFDGYRHEPAWHDRHRAMLASCREHLVQAERLDDHDVTAEWRDRMDWTEQLRC